MIGAVFIKECQELLRDRKHLMVTILLPILLTPLMMFGVGYLQVKAQDDKSVETLYYWLDERAEIPGLQSRLNQNPSLVAFESPPADVDALIRAGELDYYLRADRVDGQYVLTSIYKETELYDIRKDRLQSLVNDINTQLVQGNLTDMGVPPDEHDHFLQPLLLEMTNLTTDRENFGEILGGFLPFLIIVWIISAAIAVSSDLVAGEKERGTMETLLISPVSLLSMIVGKWLSITLFAWFAGVATLLSLWLSAWLLLSLLVTSEAFFQLISALSIGSVLLGCLLMLPTAGLISAVYLVTGSLASSFKEAQSYASGLMVVFFIPLFATLSGTIDANVLIALVPIMNTSLAFSGLLSGDLAPSFLALSLISNCLAVFAVLVLAKALFQSERVLNRQ